MKKFILILIAIYCSAFANAQLTLEYESTHNGKTSALLHANIHTVNLWSVDISGNRNLNIDTEFLGNFFKYDDDIIDLDTYSIIEKPDFNSIINVLNPNYTVLSSNCFAKGYFTNDNRICYIVTVRTSIYVTYDDYYHLYLIDENGAILQDLGTANKLYYGFVALNNGTYNFYILRTFYHGTTKLEIYSFPGNGIVTEAQNTQAPNHNNYHKYIKDDQVLIESNDRIYNTQGIYINSQP